MVCLEKHFNDHVTMNDLILFRQIFFNWRPEILCAKGFLHCNILSLFITLIFKSCPSILIERKYLTWQSLTSIFLLKGLELAYLTLWRSFCKGIFLNYVEYLSWPPPSSPCLLFDGDCTNSFFCTDKYARIDLKNVLNGLVN